MLDILYSRSFPALCLVPCASFKVFHNECMLCQLRQMCGEELAEIVSDYRGEPSISSVITEYLLSLLPLVLLISTYPKYLSAVYH